MRDLRSSSTVTATTLLVLLSPLVAAISVPTGKLTPITPAKPTPAFANPRANSAPAPVVDYSQEHPEPPPLDPSYVPATYNYFNTLSRHHVVYVPLTYRNFNNFGANSNSIEYEPPKYFGQTLGKNFGYYKPYKQRLAVPWNPQYNNNQNTQYNVQPTQQQYNEQSTQQFSAQPTQQQYINQPAKRQFNNQGNQHQFNVQATQQQSNQPAAQQFNNQGNQHQFNTQPTQQQFDVQQSQQQYNVQHAQQQQYEVVSTQTAPASSSTPQAPPTPSTDYRKVDYTTGKGSYDVTGKGGSKSEYYSKDWSKKTLYPKKATSQATGKYSHKF